MCSGTGFVRRLSKRMRHIPYVEDMPNSGKDAPAPVPTDSAYSSGADKIFNTGLQRSATTKATAEEPARPPSRLGLFPKASELPKSSTASKSGFSHSNGRHIPNALPELLPPPTKGRSMSLRNMFHRKQWSRNVVA